MCLHAATSTASHWQLGPTSPNLAQSLIAGSNNPAAQHPKPEECNEQRTTLTQKALPNKRHLRGMYTRPQTNNHQCACPY
jgi:hypothetical protein